MEGWKEGSKEGMRQGRNDPNSFVYIKTMDVYINESLSNEGLYSVCMKMMNAV